MSLINDALKRAKQAQEQQPPPALRGAPLHTVPPPAPKPSNLIPALIAAGFFALVIAGVGVFLFLRLTKPRSGQLAREISATAKASQSAPAAQPTTVTVGKTEPAPLPKPTPAPEPVAVAPAPAPAPKFEAPAQIFPVVRLQGVLFNPAHPAAIINGRTLFIGERLGELQVIGITKDTATVVWKGITNTLGLAP